MFCQLCQALRATFYVLLPACRLTPSKPWWRLTPTGHSTWARRSMTNIWRYSTESYIALHRDGDVTVDFVLEKCLCCNILRGSMPSMRHCMRYVLFALCLACRITVALYWTSARRCTTMVTCCRLTRERRRRQSVCCLHLTDEKGKSLRTFCVCIVTVGRCTILACMVLNCWCFCEAACSESSPKDSSCSCSSRSSVSQ